MLLLRVLLALVFASHRAQKLVPGLVKQVQSMRRGVSRGPG